MKTFLLFGLLTALILGLLTPIQAQRDPCEPFDQWVSAPRFDYRVNGAGDWNLPDDTQPVKSISFHNSGIEEWYSAKTDTFTFIVYLDYNATQPEGARLGQHHICVYQLPGTETGG